LKAWQKGRITTAPISSYNDSTRTNDFVLDSNDTISFYRDFQWYNPKDSRQSLDNYFSTDTLDYVVELVNASNGQRLALMDSLGALPMVPPGTPVLYGRHPIIAKIKYPVPSTMAGISAFVRVQLNARGDGLYQPIRRDGFSVGLSRALEIGKRDEYLRLFGGGLGKQVGRIRSSFESSEKSSKQVRVEMLDNRNSIIHFNSLETQGSLTVAVYDASGNMVFVPFATTKTAADGSVSYRFPSSGMFIVALMHDADIVATTKVIVK
jgi:hypothetical protein